MALKKDYETIVGSLEEALDLAKQWQGEGKFDLFRGQCRNWKLLASVHRVKNQNEYTSHLERLRILYSFMRSNQALKNYIHNPDHFIAIAQHYGLATNFIDFTADPEVAAYFATHSANPADEYACIICANRKDFREVMEFAKPGLHKYLIDGHQPDFLSFDVKNLWRLQAQKGHFLYTPFAGIETIYRFNRILFPFTKPFNNLKDEDIYPVSKSMLETYLDHFFSAEGRSRSMELLIDWIGEDKIHRLPGHNIFDYIDRKCKPHYSWRRSNIIQWRTDVGEHWNQLEKKKQLELYFSYSQIRNEEADALTEQIEQILSRNLTCRSNIVKLFIRRGRIPFNKKLNTRIQKGCNLIWNGMRKLPYTNREIAITLSRFVIMMSVVQEYKNDHYRPLIGQSVYISLSSGDGSYSHAYVGGYNILNAKRKNIYNYININDRTICKDNPVALTQLINNPRFLFTFEGFRELFVSDIIPGQTILGISDQNPVIYFNPVHIKVCGLA
ncbi:FRG domain-containing protein [Chitinophaga sp. 22620]|uniref:FRG domain-containing protein n=1 Tax=Chitinophaga sp. 22620 TaxID=3453952 RepID=UPI003F86A52A